MNDLQPSSRPVAFVSGSRRGLGAAIAVELGRSGFDVVLNGTRTDDVSDGVLRQVEAVGASARYVEFDVADIDDHAAHVEAVFQQFGRVDCVVNNAAVQVDVRGDMLEASTRSFDRVMGVNVRGAYFLLQEFVRRMLREDSPGGHPRSVVLVTSNNAVIASPQFSEYCISKAAQAMLAQLLAVRLAKTGIAVFDVRPGITRSDMSEANASRYDPIIARGDVVPMRRWGAASSVGTAVATVASGAIPFSTGEIVHIDGGMHIHNLVVSQS